MMVMMIMMIVMMMMVMKIDSNDYGDWVLDRVAAMRLINPCKSRPPRQNVEKTFVL